MNSEVSNLYTSGFDVHKTLKELKAKKEEDRMKEIIETHKKEKLERLKMKKKSSALNFHSEADKESNAFSRHRASQESKQSNNRFSVFFSES